MTQFKQGIQRLKEHSGNEGNQVRSWRRWKRNQGWRMVCIGDVKKWVNSGWVGMEVIVEW